MSDWFVIGLNDRCIVQLRLSRTVEELFTCTNNRKSPRDANGQYPSPSLEDKEQLPCTHGLENHIQCIC